MSDLSPVDYGIFTMLQEWDCQHLMRDVDKLKHHLSLTDRQSLIKRLIGCDLGRWHELWTEVDILNI